MKAGAFTPAIPARRDDGERRRLRSMKAGAFTPAILIGTSANVAGSAAQ